MTNKPMPQGSRFHDASDLHCVNHSDAVWRKGIKPNPARACPVCSDKVPHNAAPSKTPAATSR